MSHQGQGFFGLTQNDRLAVHEEIFTLLNYGNGGYIFNDVYHMPVYLRKFYLQRLSKEYKDIAKEREKLAKQVKKQTFLIFILYNPKQINGVINV